jgi:hypothetical protein
VIFETRAIFNLFTSLKLLILEGGLGLCTSQSYVAWEFSESQCPKDEFLTVTHKLSSSELVLSNLRKPPPFLNSREILIGIHKRVCLWGWRCGSSGRMLACLASMKACSSNPSAAKKKKKNVCVYIVIFLIMH